MYSSGLVWFWIICFAAVWFSNHEFYSQTEVPLEKASRSWKHLSSLNSPLKQFKTNNKHKSWRFTAWWYFRMKLYLAVGWCRHRRGHAFKSTDADTCMTSHAPHTTCMHAYIHKQPGLSSSPILMACWPSYIGHTVKMLWSLRYRLWKQSSS